MYVKIIVIISGCKYFIYVTPENPGYPVEDITHSNCIFILMYLELICIKRSIICNFYMLLIEIFFDIITFTYIYIYNSLRFLGFKYNSKILLLSYVDGTYVHAELEKRIWMKRRKNKNKSFAGLHFILWLIIQYYANEIFLSIKPFLFFFGCKYCYIVRSRNFFK